MLVIEQGAIRKEIHVESDRQKTFYAITSPDGAPVAHYDSSGQTCSVVPAGAIVIYPGDETYVTQDKLIRESAA